MPQVALTRTEKRVLAGMRLSDSAHAQDVAEAQRHTDKEINPRTLQGVAGILSATNIARSGGRRTSEREVRAALRGLVAKGLVKSDYYAGMGGGFTLYQLVEEDPS